MRISIIGNSGSGKSVLARELAAELDVPVLDLDTVAWEPGKIAVPTTPEKAARLVNTFCRRNSQWVVEGCYANLICATFEWSPHLIFMNPGEEQCVENCLARPLESHKYKTKEEQDSKLAFLVTWVREYYKRDDDMSYFAHRACFAATTVRKSKLPKILFLGNRFPGCINEEDNFNNSDRRDYRNSPDCAETQPFCDG